MAQTQTQREGSATERRGVNVPATSGPEGQQVRTRDRLPSWAGGGPFGLMRRLSNDIDQLFGQLIGGSGVLGQGAGAIGSPMALAPPVDWIPTLEIFERDGKLVIQADLPGIDRDNIEIDVTDDVLTLSGERREEREIDNGGIRGTERRYGRFARAVVLPEGARTDEIQATLDNGVLEIAIPLQQQTSQRGRRVEIQRGERSGRGDGGQKQQTQG